MRVCVRVSMFDGACVHVCDGAWFIVRACVTVCACVPHGAGGWAGGRDGAPVMVCDGSCEDSCVGACTRARLLQVQSETYCYTIDAASQAKPVAACYCL